jgi:excinuclease ABC subunit A
MNQDVMLVGGARQNNLKGLDLEIPLHQLIVVTGVSGSGKSSLAFDTIYAEGQRRYVETFSPYARQFLDRMDKPRVERIEGIPPAIAIDQTNPVRTSRSTVGTMTELADHLKLLFARVADLYCRRCGRRVRRDTAQSVCEQLLALDRAGESPALITFPITVPENFGEAEVLQLLERQGYTRVHTRRGSVLEIVQDRVRLSAENRSRITEDLEAAFKIGGGRASVFPQGGEDPPLRFSSDLHCPDCDIHYREPVPSMFSFNSPLGACETCRGFGRTMGIDYGLVIPDEGKSLEDGAVRPWQTQSYGECQDDMMKFAPKRGIPVDVPWRELTEAQRNWVIEGEGPWSKKVWYGARRFFDWLETKSYKMHIRVLLSKYRAYNSCSACGGARLKTEGLLYRLGSHACADRAMPRAARFRPAGTDFTDQVLLDLPGLTIHDVMLLPIDRCGDFFENVRLPAPLDEATDMLVGEIRTRLRYLVEVGLGYLTLDRQSRTLSGGEVQRINLTTALGTSLVNTLFVLDEPSIGLHPRDVRRIVGVLERLRDAGNSLLVVEHDPQIMLAADQILDLGPGPGEAGGRAVFFGPPDALIRDGDTLTAQYLRGERTVSDRARTAGSHGIAVNAWLEVQGAAEHNLKGVDVRIPLGHFVCVTGVSGSGKSTLIEEVLYRGLAKLKGKPVDVPGRHQAIKGHEHIDKAVLIDQSPIGKTTRSNPASYVGALDAIRRLFAEEPLAKERGYTAGTFSFNAGNGRCATCGGNGFEHVEMQFLSDVYLRCPDCDGRRYRAEVLEVRWRPAGPARETQAKSIADVLEMTVDEAVAFFAGHADVLRSMEPLQAVGLGYLRLGQPVPTLSGGEAQRLKLAGNLAAGGNGGNGGKGALFLFDEPTTGLHFDDVAKLLQAFRRLLKAGHSLVVIEHNLDVIRAADWIVDLGPEGGDRGGEVVCVGTPEQVARHAQSHTGAALRDYEAVIGKGFSPPAKGGVAAKQPAWLTEVLGATPPPTVAPLLREEGKTSSLSRAIRIHNAREHNLKNIDLQIPRDRFTVITGVSGSGKSTVAFDILFAEGQRRYLESLNAYARQFVQPAARPEVDAIYGIPPTVAIEQRTSRGGRKSTVATVTEIYHFLRLLFVKLGVQHCPDCGTQIEPQTPESIVAKILRERRGRRVDVLAPLVVARKGYYTDLAKWAAGKGHAHLRVDGERTPTENWPRLARYKEHDIELPVGSLEVGPRSERELRVIVDEALAYGKGSVIIASDGARARAAAKSGSRAVRAERPGKPGAGKVATHNGETIFSTKRACPRCSRSFPEPDPRLFSYNSKHGWCESCYGTGVKLAGFDADQTGEEIWWNDWWEGEAVACPQCAGSRLNPTALAVRFRGDSIAELARLSVAAAQEHFRKLRLRGREAEIARDILAELDARLAFLSQVGLAYLSLDRAAPTLSGGEAQRIRLAAQLGSNLRGVCYILDEPTIGLHPHDNQRLLATLTQLRDKGNAVVVVEHDEETIRRAEHLIDLGPGAGVRGGRVVAQGSLDDVMRCAESVTGRAFASPLAHPVLGGRRPTALAGTAQGRTAALELVGVKLHNLKNLRVQIPLTRLVCVTGVSGSGKSTLVREVLHDNLHALVGAKRARAALRGCREIRGAERIARVLEVDQTPIDIRKLFAGTPDARLRGYQPGRFSFNVAGGRCDACEGQGVKTIEMSFLPDVKVLCDVCAGHRFNGETLAVRYRERTIAEILAMSVDEAVDFFSAHPAIHHALQLLQDVGLGYLTLGQASPTLSGGEAQRIKLVTELAKFKPAAPAHVRKKGVEVETGAKGTTLYVLDEPTIGLHMADVEKLIRVLHRLVDAGNSVVIIEHDLDVVAEADWVIDLGPEGGEAGGNIVAQGTPEGIAADRRGSHTATALARFLPQRRRTDRKESAIATG